MLRMCVGQRLLSSGQHVCRGRRISTISKCVDMASACDIPRLVQCVLCTKTLLRWLLRDLRWIQRWPDHKRRGTRVTGNESSIF